MGLDGGEVALVAPDDRFAPRSDNPALAELRVNNAITNFAALHPSLQGSFSPEMAIDDALLLGMGDPLAPWQETGHPYPGDPEVLGKGGDIDDLGWAGTFNPYPGPLPNEILPASMFDGGGGPGGGWMEIDFIDKKGSNGYTYTGISSIHMFAMYTTISYQLKDQGVQGSAAIQWEAINGQNAPQETNFYGQVRQGVWDATLEDWALPPQGYKPDNSTWWIDWMGCRCAWPISQQCYAHLWVGTYYYLLVWWSLINLAWQVLMVDTSIADQFLSAIPGTTLWSDWWNSDVEFLPKLWWPLSEFLGYFFVISGILDTDSHSVLQCMHQRYLLRTMATRYEGQTYGYFMVAYWACIVEITTVIFTGYLGLFFPLSIWNSNSGFPLEDIGWGFIVWGAITGMQDGAKLFWNFLTCGGGTCTDYLWGVRAQRALVVSTYTSYYYQFIIVMALYFMLHAYPVSALYMWTIPMSMPPVFPAHTGGIILVMGLSTLVVYMCCFFVRFGCMMFPCLCAPDVPGYLFFPPTVDAPNTVISGDT